MDIGIAVEIGIFGLGSIISISVMWGRLSQQITDNKETRELQIQDIKDVIEEIKDELHNGYVCSHHQSTVEKLSFIEGRMKE
jgi:hypothetical protein